jgi:hypothetical protein
MLTKKEIKKEAYKVFELLKNYNSKDLPLIFKKAEKIFWWETRGQKLRK